MSKQHMTFDSSLYKYRRFDSLIGLPTANKCLFLLLLPCIYMSLSQFFCFAFTPSNSEYYGQIRPKTNGVSRKTSGFRRDRDYYGRYISDSQKTLLLSVKDGNQVPQGKTKTQGDILENTTGKKSISNLVDKISSSGSNSDKDDQSIGNPVEQTRRNYNRKNDNNNNNNNKKNFNNNYRNKDNNNNKKSNYWNSNRSMAHRRKSEVISTYTNAQKALRKGQLEEAENLFRQCLMIDRKDPHSWLGLARLATRKGNLEEANNFYTQGVSECPKSVHLLQAWALLESRCNNIERARTLFAKGIDLEPGNPYITHAWGDLERKQMNPEKARELYSTSLKLRGPWAQLYIAASELEIEDGKIEEAKRILEEGIDRCLKDSNKVLIALAKLEEQLIGDTDRAVILLSEAIHTGRDRDDVEPSIALAQLEIRRGNYRVAIDVMKRARNLKGVDASLFNVWASLEAKSGRMEESMHILQEALVLFPDDNSVLQSLGTLECKRGNYDKARQYLSKSISNNPTVAAYNAWAILEEKASRMKGNTAVRDVALKKARNLFVAGLLVDSTHGPLYNAYGSMEEKIGNITGARDVYSCGVKAQCTDAASVWHGWASLEIRQGNYDLAKKLLRQGLNMGDAQNNLNEIDELIASYKDPKPEKKIAFFSAGDTFPEEDNNMEGVSLFSGVLSAPGLNPPFKFQREVNENTHSSLAGALNEMESSIPQGSVERKNSKVQRNSKNIMIPTTEEDTISASLSVKPQGQQYKKKTKSRGNLAFLYHTLGMLEMNHVTKSNLERNPYRSNLEEAKLVFEEALSLYPRSSQIAVGAALVYERLDMIDEARTLFRKGVKLDKNHEQAWQAWAVMERKQGNIQKARTLFESGIAANPKHGALWQAYAVLEVHEKEVERARSLFKEGIKRDSTHVMLYQALACLEVRLENAEESRALIKEGLRHEPTHGACWSVYGIIEEKFGTPEEARNIFEAGIANSKPEHAPLFRVFADFERRCQNFAKARELYEKAINVDPYYSTAYAMYASMETKIGNMANFRRIVTRAQQLIGDKFDWNPNNPFSLPTNRYLRERDFNEF